MDLSHNLTRPGTIVIIVLMVSAMRVEAFTMRLGTTWSPVSAPWFIRCNVLITLDHGIVSVTEEWAAQHGLPPSAPTPDTPGELVYQVDGFHAMHCLVSFRPKYHHLR